MFENDFDSNIFKAIRNIKPLKNLNNYLTHAYTLKKYQNNDNFLKIKENATRVSRIIKDSSFDKVKENLFTLNEEKALYNAIITHNESLENLEKYIISLNQLIAPITQFFDNVLVMDKDEDIKNNRIALLNLLKAKFDAVCNFEKL